MVTLNIWTAGEKGSWVGFNNSFTNPAPWYFRTLETWKNLFLKNGFALNKIIEPLNAATNKAASVIFVGQLSKALVVRVGFEELNGRKPNCT